MSLFYRGAGVGTHWHANDARLSGFTPHSPGIPPSPSRLMMHVARATVSTPYVSLTRSYGVAANYAIYFGRVAPSATNPAYVYEVEFLDPVPTGLQLLDPVKETAAALAGPLTAAYQHDGEQSFLLGVVSPVLMTSYLTAPYLQPPPGGGTPRPPNLSLDLETLVRALRDAETLAIGTIPAACIRRRMDVW